MSEKAGVLSGISIQQELKMGRIRIDPLNPQNFNPASYDLTLGAGVLVYRDLVEVEPVQPKKVFGSHLSPRRGTYTGDYPTSLDAAKDNPTIPLEMSKEGFLIKPGIGYLMHTEERVWTDTFIPVLDGKSSIGRLFVKVHETAGYGDAGFDGQYTLEVTAMHPVILYPGMAICQIRFHTIVGKPEMYQKRGHYTGDKARGPIPSQSFLQIKERA